MTIYAHAKGYCCYDFSKFTHRSTELHDDRFLTDVTCDTGKNIHKTLISKFLYKKIHKSLRSFCRKQNNNFGGFLPIVIKITNNFTKYVMHHQLFSLFNFLIRHGFHIFYNCVHIWHLLLAAFTATNSYVHPRICASECHNWGTMHKKSSNFV